MIPEIEHIDGVWKTTEFVHGRYFKIVMKSKKNHGMKAHIFYAGKVLKTFRYRYIKPDALLERCKNWIDSNGQQLRIIINSKYGR